MDIDFINEKLNLIKMIADLMIVSGTGVQEITKSTVLDIGNFLYENIEKIQEEMANFF